MITQIPASGRFTVDTLDATYDVDLDARIVTRWDSAAEGAGAAACMTVETFVVDEVGGRVGDSMVVDYWFGDVDQAEGVHVSTQILGITPARVEVTA